MIISASITEFPLRPMEFLQLCNVGSEKRGKKANQLKKQGQKKRLNHE
ncbi:MAG: hypothetical protein ACMUEL_08550 [Flavobacteriales bacterium Tduv]